jgi:VWFA-related protein
MRTSAGVAACAAIAALWTSLASAQQDVYVTLVHTRFTATDRRGRAVTTLGRDDIAVYDNDVARPLSDFGRHVDAPVRIAMVVDRSQSVAGRLPLLLSAATAFSQSALKGSSDQGLLVAFDSKVYLIQDWTGDGARLAQAVRGLIAAGGTSMFDAVYKTCRDKFEVADTPRNVLVLVTDGDDTTSQATFDQALQMATVSRVTVYVIGTGAEASLNTRELQGRQVLSRLAEVTGGRLFYPGDRSDTGLETLFARVGEEIGSAYSLSYYLDAPPDGSFHRVRIEPRDRSLAVHAPSGYYTRKPSLVP